MKEGEREREYEAHLLAVSALVDEGGGAVGDELAPEDLEGIDFPHKRDLGEGRELSEGSNIIVEKRRGRVGVIVR